ncbi:MAG: glutathione synthase, partial [Pusillimonas sp.]|nr:glutathione synthase [Pusillimonas sp.]
MHILFIIDPLPSLKAYKDSSVAMMRALCKRGHTISVALQGDLYIDEGVVKVEGQPVNLILEADLRGQGWWSVAGDPAEVVLAHFDAVVMRKDPPFDMEYVYSTHLLDFAQTQGAKVFNAGQAIRNHPEKLAITEFAAFTSPTLVSRNMARLRAFYAKHQNIILKPLDGMGGAGIFHVRPDGANLGAILETLTDNGARTIMAQRYIPEIKDGDKRILLINGEPAPYALARIPLAGETRGNLAAGGRGVAQPLTVRDRQIAESIGPKVRERGLLLVGLDVIGD